MELSGNQGDIMRTFAALLLASTCLFTAPVFAQDEDLEQGPDGVDASEAWEGEPSIVVFGRGETRQVQQIDSEDIQILTPGSSPIKAIEKLPSVNVQASDPFGNYEWSTRLTIRAFSQSQLGFNFDGIPLGDMQYGNHNGLHISRIVSPENIGSVRVSQGAGAIGTQSTNNLGGTIEAFSLDPLDRLGGQANATYGSNQTIRAFARLNVGSAGGFRGFVSYGYGSTDKWKGQGTQDQHMVNVKGVLPVGDGEIDAWFSYSDRREQDYQDMSLDMLDRLGYESDNTFPDYALAVLLADIGANRGDTGVTPTNPAAGTVYPGAYTSVDDAYYDASGLRKDTVAALGYRTPLGEAANVAIKGYYHHNEGMGLWGTPYTPSPSGVPMSIRTTEYDINRWGVFGSADFELGINAVSLGAWYEHNEFNQARRFYGYESRTVPGRSFRDYPTEPILTQWDFDFTTDTLQYHIRDAIDLGRVRINLGWKGFKVTNQAVANVNTVFPEGEFATEDWFQPHAGVVFSLNDNAEVFAGYTQATRAFPSVNGSIWGTTQAGFDAIKDTIKPETSETYEVGARYNTGSFNGVLGAYLVDFKDRLLGVASGPDIIGSPSVLQNVGSVRAIGLEAAGDWKITPEVSLFASYTWTDATYRDDVVDGAGNITELRGSTVIDSPRHMARAELSYDNGGLFARAALNYMSKRYFTYTNDLAPGDGLGYVDGRAVADATLGYRFGEDGRYEIQLNASNLFDEQYIGTINSAGTGNRGDRQTLLVGAPRQFFATLKAGF